MKVIDPSFKVLTQIDGLDVLARIESAGRTCYKSEENITPLSSMRFVSNIISRGHESVIEHVSVSVRIICDRGVTHELVRHRLCAYSQESTRYCNYEKEDEITVISPYFFDPFEERKKIALPIIEKDKDGMRLTDPHVGFEMMMNSFDVWFLTCLWTQWGYMTLIKEFKAKPQQARSVLPNSLKTEIVVTANLREWRHIFRLRTAKDAHPQMREIMVPLLQVFQEIIPVVFDNIQP
jgi:thymidylate synthase (FAD)